MFNTNRIKELRITKKLSQLDIAKVLGVSRSSYAMWETNNNIIPLKRLLELSNFYNVSLDYMLGFNNQNYEINENYNKDKSKERLKDFRKENNITQEKLANILKIDQPTWSIYESGKSLIGTPFLYTICKKYNISADYLLGKTDSPKYLK